MPYPVKGNNSVVFHVEWTAAALDQHHQYYATGGVTFYNVVPLLPMLEEARLQVDAGATFGKVLFDNRGDSPGGTIVGVYTRHRAGLAPDAGPSALDRMELPPIPQHTTAWGVNFNLEANIRAIFKDYHFFICYGMLGNPALVPRYLDAVKIENPDEGGPYHVYTGGRGIGPDLPGFWGCYKRPPRKICLAYVYVVVSRSAITPPDPLYPGKTFVFHHNVKRNTEIVPADGTILFPGQFFNVYTYPTKKNAVLTEFSVGKSGEQVEQLPGALIDVEEFNDPVTGNQYVGLSIPDLYADNEGIALMTYGPVDSNVYASAIADGETIEGEMPIDIQMYTTDCLVEPGSWELGEDNMPDGVTVTISEDGLVHFDMSIDVWKGIVGGQYYQDVIFNGYSQTLTKRLLLTVSDIPAYGTVWDAVGLVGTTPIVDLLVASDNTVYIATKDKIYKTDSDLSVFTEMTLSGTVTTAFGGLAEASDGRILAMDNRYAWLMDLDGEGFTVTSMSNGYRYWNVGNKISADPASNIIFLHGTNMVGSAGRVDMYDLDTQTFIDYWNTDQAGGSGWCYAKVVYADNGSYILIGGGSGEHTIRIIRSLASYAYIVETTGYGNHQARACKLDDGTIIVVGRESATQIFIQSSADNGETFTSKTLMDISEAPSAVFSILGNYGLIGSNNIYRTTDAFATEPTSVSNPDGSVVAFGKLSNNVLLCATTGTTTNLYKSEA